MARSVRRRRKQRVYWVEIGFLILGLIVLRPSLVAEIAAMGRGESDRNVSRYPSNRENDPGYQARTPNAVGFRSYYPDWTPTPQQSFDPRTAVGNSAWPPQVMANHPDHTVAWPDAQVHQWIHRGAVAPHVASPMTHYPSIPNASPSPYPSANPPYTGRY